MQTMRYQLYVLERKEALSKKTLQTKRKKRRRYLLTLIKVLVLYQCFSHYSINAFIKYLTNTYYCQGTSIYKEEIMPIFEELTVSQARLVKKP